MSGEALVFFFSRPVLGGFGVVPKVPGLGNNHFVLVAYGFELGVEGREVASKLGVNGCRVPGFNEIGFEELLQRIGQCQSFFGGMDRGMWSWCFAKGKNKCKSEKDY